MQSRGNNSGFLRGCLMLSAGEPASLSCLPWCTAARPCTGPSHASTHSLPEAPTRRAASLLPWLPGHPRRSQRQRGLDAHSVARRPEPLRRAWCGRAAETALGLLFISIHVAVWWFVSSSIQGPQVSSEWPNPGTGLPSRKMPQSRVLDCL